ncbi:hypothetical protein BX600DRAFT_266074 [Xylariales sp. PMI_506]|nr:hypothetical protein BX600DRAFT_266074 [Xylariales sp. PMI_506]
MATISAHPEITPTGSAGERIKLPGFGMPRQEMPIFRENDGEGDWTYLRFPNAIADWCGSSGVTVYERKMLAVINHITDKPKWDEKVFDELIVEKWWKEVEEESKEATTPQPEDEEEEDEEEQEDAHVGEMIETSDNEDGGNEPENDKQDADSIVEDDENGEQEDDIGSEESDDAATITYFSRKMFDYCMKELQDKAIRFRETGMVSVCDTEATVVKSDSAVPATLRDSLQAAVKPLEDVPDSMKDWHPDSDDMVLDLVHPSLFPLVYGRTKVLPTGVVPLSDCIAYTGKGERIEGFEPTQENTHISKRNADTWESSDRRMMPAWDEFHWLPSDVSFNENGKVSIDSYINNLHPVRHHDLYQVLERMVECAIPMWNESLSWFQDRIRIKPERTGSEDWTRPDGAKSPEWVKPDDWDQEKRDKMMDHEYDNRYQEWFREVRVLKHLEPGNYVSLSETTNRAGAMPINLAKKFKDSGLQIIFKLANIHLDPTQPEYEGGTWHVEGTLNEHICATALYYYDQDNITDSYLSFRQPIGVWETLSRPEQYEYASCEAYYGVKHEESGTLIQVLGSVKTSADRLLVFPNVLQHQVSPFSLEDPTKPGHRKILAMFLVDPNIRVLSTANVPPQRRDWWADEVRKINPFATLPPMIFNQIISEVDEPWSWDEATKIREALMERRSVMNDDINNDMNDAQVSFCEH